MKKKGIIALAVTAALAAIAASESGLSADFTVTRKYENSVPLKGPTKGFV